MNSMLLYALIVISVILCLALFPLYIAGEIAKKNNAKLILSRATNLLTRYNKLSIGMTEEEMLNIMNFRYDKSCTEEYTSYRFVFISKGGSGSTEGYVAGGPLWDGRFAMSGRTSGSSEQHDESVVVIKCKNGKVTEIMPYNMSVNIIPKDYKKLLEFGKSLGIFP